MRFTEMPCAKAKMSDIQNDYSLVQYMGKVHEQNTNYR